MASKLNSQERKMIFKQYQRTGNALMSAATYKTFRYQLGLHTIRETQGFRISKLLIAQRYSITKESDCWASHPVKEFFESKETMEYYDTWELLGFADIFAPTTIQKIEFTNHSVLTRRTPKKSTRLPYNHYFEVQEYCEESEAYVCILAIPLTESPQYVFLRATIRTKERSESNECDH